MLVTQPPVPSVTVFVTFDAGDHGVCYHKSSGNRAGVAFGDVFKTVAGIAPAHKRRRARGWWVSLNRQVFVVSSEARKAVERAGGLSSEEDPTRWVLNNGEHVLQEDGFEF